MEKLLHRKSFRAAVCLNTRIADWEGSPKRQFVPDDLDPPRITVVALELVVGLPASPPERKRLMQCISGEPSAEKKE